MAELLDHLGAAVLHSLWQGALILALVALFRRSVGDRPHLSYLAAMAGMAAAFGAFLGTLVWRVASGSSEPGWMPAAITTPAAGLTETAASSVSASWASPVTALPMLGFLWAVGFVLLTLQASYALARTRRLATQGLSAPEQDWADRFSVLVARSGITAPVRLRVSALVQSPVTLGTLRPLVLVPAGFLTRLPAAQIEAVLLHELAHIRRHDFAFGLVQTAIRTTLYFNQAVLILSRWASEDREQACDDDAVSRMGGHTADPTANHAESHPSGAVDLAKGLAHLRLSLAPAPALAARDRSGPLMARLARLTGRPARPRGLDRLSALGIGAALVGATVFATSSLAHPPEYPSELTRNSELPDTVVPPSVGPEPPVMPLPPAPAVPTRQWEQEMEDWGERMEAWGDTLGERMESWAEQMEDRGARVEALHEMSDRQLRALGLSRDDVEAAAQDFGLDVAEAVVVNALPQYARDEALEDIQRQRAALNADALRRVSEAQARMQYTQDRSSDMTDRLRIEAVARRAEADARHQALQQRLDAERALRRTQRPNPERPARLGDVIAAQMVADGLLDAESDDIHVTLRRSRLELNRRPVTGEARDRYMALLKDFDIDPDNSVELQRKGNNHALSVQRN